jgi:hypothetical protein
MSAISDALGTIGIVAIAGLLVMVVIALAFGFTALIYVALLLTLLAFAAILILCRGPTQPD